MPTTKKKSSSPLAFLGKTIKKSHHPSTSLSSPVALTSQFSIYGKIDPRYNNNKESRQDERDDNNARQEEDSDDSSCSSKDSSLDQKELIMDLKEQVTMVEEKESEVRKWQQIYQAQRENIDAQILKWQGVYENAAKEHRAKCEDAKMSWENALMHATKERDVWYEEEMKKWKLQFQIAKSSWEMEQVKLYWDRLEAGRGVPTKDMKHASERLRQLEESMNAPSKAMEEAKRMIDEMIQARDAPMNEMTVTKKQKKYVKDVMKWQDTLNEATAKHQKDCDKWEQALKESKNTKEMKRVRRMLKRLIATRDVPTSEMEEASLMLQKLEQEEGAYTTFLKYAKIKVHKLEKELVDDRDAIVETKSMIGDAVDLNNLPNSFDNSSLGEESAVSQEGSPWLGFNLNQWLPQGMFGKAEEGDDSVSVSVTSSQ